MCVFLHQLWSPRFGQSNVLSHCDLSHLGEQCTQTRWHSPKMEQIRPILFEKYFLRKFNENFEKSKILIFRKKSRKIKIYDFSKFSLNFRKNIFRKMFGRICPIFEECHRVWVNCSPRWNDIFDPVFFVLQGMD